MLVDDEPPAIELLKKHISTLTDLEVVATCYSAVEASEKLQKESVDLLFLDIQMPVLTGLDFLRTVKNLPQVIITTAHRKYALDGYDLDIVDYLLKPISYERFFKAIQRYYQLDRPARPTVANADSTTKANHIFVNFNKKNRKVLFEDILYIESLKDYVRIHTSSDNLVVKGNIGALTALLPKDQFVRVHRSFVVATEKVTAFTSQDIEIGDIEIPIGQTYKEAVKSLK